MECASEDCEHLHDGKKKNRESRSQESYRVQHESEQFDSSDSLSQQIICGWNVFDQVGWKSETWKEEQE